MRVPSWVSGVAIGLAIAGVSMAAVQAETGKGNEPAAKNESNSRTSVRAPYTDVDVDDRNVRVDAPFTGVRVDRDRVRVRAPFVDRDIRR